MKPKNHPCKALWGLLLSLTLVAAGCTSGGGPDPTAQAKGVETAKSLRSYFDKAQGNYEALSETDKAEYIKLSGGEAKAIQNWNLMKNGPGAIDRSAPSAPSGQ